MVDLVTKGCVCVCVCVCVRSQGAMLVAGGSYRWALRIRREFFLMSVQYGVGALLVSEGHNGSPFSVTVKGQRKRGW